MNQSILLQYVVLYCTVLQYCTVQKGPISAIQPILLVQAPSLTYKKYRLKARVLRRGAKRRITAVMLFLFPANQTEYSTAQFGSELSSTLCNTVLPSSINSTDESIAGFSIEKLHEAFTKKMLRTL
jgi:hypothetical protein